MFWDYDSESWSDHGCVWDKGTSSLLRTVCRCNHLTNFGLMFDITGALDDWDEMQLAILNYLSIILMSLSTVAASVTFLILQLSKYDNCL